MDGGDDHAAAGALFRHKLRHQRSPLDIQRRRRFIEKPDRPRLDQKADKRQTPLLAGRETPAGHLFAAGKTDAFHRCKRNGVFAAKVKRPEGCLFGGGFGWFDCVEMSEVVVPRLFLPGHFERHRSIMRPGEAGENAKQGRFARSVRTAQFKHFPTGKLERQAFEQDSKPSRRSEIFDLKDQ